LSDRDAPVATRQREIVRAAQRVETIRAFIGPSARLRTRERRSVPGCVNAKTVVTPYEKPPRANSGTAERTHRVKGHDVRLAGAPRQVIEEAPAVASVGLVTADHPGLRADLRVREGERVVLGQPLVHDRNSTGIVFTSPGAGVVRDIRVGDDREVRSVAVELDGDDERTFVSHARDQLPQLDPARVREMLLDSGLWPVLRTRPFGGIADPGVHPHALFVQAIDSNPWAPSPDVALAGAHEAFVDGLTVLSRLLDGSVFVCAAPQTVLPAPLPEPVVVARFAGPHPAGLPGTHIHKLAPVGPGRSVWHVGYQDVVAIGRFFTEGRLSVERVVSLAGPTVRRPRLLRTRLGSHVGELVRGELLDSPCRVISGSVLAGRTAAGSAAFLGRYDLQISVLPDHRSPAGRRRRFGRPTAKATSTSLHGRPGPMIPIEGFDRVFPFDFPVVPLLRALLVGDAEAASDLGCLELTEEDLALCTYLCPGKNEYGALLRSVLGQLGERA
jgi:Na+-transporting NADH:ubiquinone oxidoreductase subunit A